MVTMLQRLNPTLAVGLVALIATVSIGKAILAAVLAYCLLPRTLWRPG